MFKIFVEHPVPIRICPAYQERFGTLVRRIWTRSGVAGERVRLGREIGRHFYDEFGGRKLYSVDFQGMPADKA